MSETDFTADNELDAEIEIPRRAELSDPITGEAIVDVNGKPAYVMLYSGASRAFQERAFKTQARHTKARQKMGGEITFEMSRRNEAQIYACAFAGEWHIVKKNKDDKKWHPIDAPCTFENACNWVFANPLYKPQLSSKADNLQSYIDGDDVNFTIEASPLSSKRSKRE